MAAERCSFQRELFPGIEPLFSLSGTAFSVAEASAVDLKFPWRSDEPDAIGNFKSRSCMKSKSYGYFFHLRVGVKVGHGALRAH
jgi:hypothetical protein